MSQSFYEMLDVPRTASQSQILDAYFGGLREAHPGVTVSSDHHRVRDRYEAFAVLSDSAAREKYDAALAGAELCPWCGRLLAAYGLEQHVADHVVEDANDGCIVCGRLPSRRLVFRANSGRILWRKLDKIEGHLCKTCATGVYRAMQTRNLARGLWSIVSIFTTPIDLIRNWLTRRKVSSMASPRPHDNAYDRGTGLGKPIFRSAGVWTSIFAVVAVFTVGAFVFSSGGSSPEPDSEVSQSTTTTVDPHDGWIVGGCAEFDVAGRIFPAECGDHFATVVALVDTAAECPDPTDFSVPLTEGVACFEES